MTDNLSRAEKVIAFIEEFLTVPEGAGIVAFRPPRPDTGCGIVGPIVTE